MSGPWEDYAPPAAAPAATPAAAGPWTDYAPPASDGDYLGGLKQLMSAPKPDRAAIHAYVTAHNRADSGTLDPAIDWIGQHPGHAGDVRYQDTGPQQGKPETMAVAPDNGAGSAIRGVAQGLTGGFGDKIGAAIGTVIPTAGEQNIWQGHGFGDAYAHNKAFEFGQSDADNNAHPYTYNGGQVAGAVGLGAISGGAGLALPEAAEGAGLGARVGSKLAPAAAYGAAYGAGQSQADTYGGEALDAAKGAGIGVAGGAIGGAVAKGAGALLQGISDPIKQALYKAGTRFTPGQLFGGEGMERKLSSLPFTGSQINARLGESNQGWQTETLNRALKPYGTQIPEGVTGTAAIAHGQDAVKATFDKARSGLQVAKTDEFNTGISALKDKAVNGGTEALSPQYQRNLNGVIKNNVLNKFNSDGVMSAQDYTKAASDIRKAAGKFSGGQNDANAQAYGASLKQLVDHLDQAALNNPASDPAAAAQLQKARAAYGEWKTVTGAANRGGIDTPGQFTPSQYLQEVKKRDSTMDKSLFNSGNAPGQQWGQRGLDALGKAPPNSFTADRVFAGKLATEGLAAGAGAMIHGTAAHAALLAPIAADALGSIAYSRPVNNMTNKLALGARPDIVSKVGKQLNAFAPKAALAGGGATLAIQHTTP